MQKIFEDYAAGRPTVNILRELNSIGLKTASDKPFTVNSIAHILNNRAYIGEYRYADIVKPDGMPAIITPELFEASQKRLILNKRQGGQRANGLDPDNAPRFWLTGKLCCGECGTPHGLSRFCFFGGCFGVSVSFRARSCSCGAYGVGDKTSIL